MVSNNLEKNEKQLKGHNINEKEETIFDLYMLIIGYVIIITFGIFFHNFFYNLIPSYIMNFSIIMSIVLPLVLYTYYIFYQIHSIREHKSYEVLIKEANNEIEKEEKISQAMPYILFGIGIIYSALQKITKNKKLLKLVTPYLIFSLIFGTVIPYLVSYLIFDYSNLHRLILASDFDFISISLAFGAIFTGLIMPFFVSY
jgi:hypothetical protein